jgi:Holliday junction resolvase RusA-like endonuclease
MSFRTIIPLTPSLNNAYPTDYKTGRRFSSATLVGFKSAAIPLITVAATMAEWTAPTGARLRLTLRHWFPDRRALSASDADNRIKAAKDALAEALGINDNRIYSVTSIKAGVDADDPRTEIELGVM